MPGPKSAQILRMAGWRIRGMRTRSLGPAAARRLAIEYGFNALWNLDNYMAFIWKEADPYLPPPYDPNGPPPYESDDPPPYDPNGPPPYDSLQEG